MTAPAHDRSALPSASRPDDLPGSASTIAGLVRLIGLAALLIGAAETIAGIRFDEPRAITLGVTAAVYGVWVAGRVGRLTGDDRERTITWIASLTLALVGLAAFLQPSIATAMAIASLLPAVIVTPIVSSRIVLRLLILSGLVGAWSVAIGAVVADTNRLPVEAQSGIAFITLVLAYAFLIVFLWEVSRRLKATASDLQSVVRMSGDLAQTLDPRLVGDRIAVHIARAVGADDCALSYWDRATNRVVTLGYEPPERRAALNETYGVDEFPATREVLETQMCDPRRRRRSCGRPGRSPLPRLDRPSLHGDDPARRCGPDDRARRGDGRSPECLRSATGRARDDVGGRGRDGSRECPPLRPDPPPGAA